MTNTEYVNNTVTTTSKMSLKDLKNAQRKLNMKDQLDWKDRILATAIAQEIRYSYKQNQTIYDGLSSLLDKSRAI